MDRTEYLEMKRNEIRRQKEAAGGAGSGGGATPGTGTYR
jgi:hypothetical protein